MDNSSIKLFMLMVGLIMMRISESDGYNIFSAFKRHEIYIYSNLPNETSPLVTRCRSKHDFGNQTLYSGQHVNWHLRNKLFEKNLYYCEFRWGLKKQGFLVFNSEWLGDFHTYNYVVRPEGFYVGHDKNDRMATSPFSLKWI